MDPVFLRSFAGRVCRQARRRPIKQRSGLSGFTKKNDLRYFLKAICGIDYVHCEQFAPTQGMLDEYKKKRGLWSDYERKFFGFNGFRQIESTDKQLLEP